LLGIPDCLPRLFVTVDLVEEGPTAPAPAPEATLLREEGRERAAAAAVEGGSSSSSSSSGSAAAAAPESNGAGSSSSEEEDSDDMLAFGCLFQLGGSLLLGRLFACSALFLLVSWMLNGSTQPGEKDSLFETKI
jgi:hypothetical protein